MSQLTTIDLKSKILKIVGEINLILLTKKTGLNNFQQLHLM